MNIYIVVLTSCDQADPDIQPIGFSIEVEFRGTVRRLCESTEFAHGVQAGHFRKVKEGVVKAIDLLGNFPFRLLLLTIKPGCPPSAAIVVRPGICDLANGMRCAAQRDFLCLAINMRESTFCFQRNIVWINNDVIYVFLCSVPLREGEWLGRNTSTGFIISAGITDMNICLSA